MKLDGSDWPAVAVEANCATCGRVLFSEGIRPTTLAKYASIAWYWRDQIVAHLATCPGSGESGRSTSESPAEGSTGPTGKNGVERPDSNKTGRSDVVGGPVLDVEGFVLAIETVPACTTCKRVGHVAAECPNEGGPRGNA